MVKSVRVGPRKDLAVGEMKGAEAGGKPILLVNMDGTYYAVGNVCTHMGCMLSDGLLKGDAVECMCHGSIFNVRDGSVVKGPARSPLPVFQAKVEGEQILVNV